MEKLSFNAKTLDEAITKACVELGVTSDRLSYSIKDQGSKGFLGIGARNCVIEASVKDNDRKPAEKKIAEEKAVKKEDKIQEEPKTSEAAPRQEIKREPKAVAKPQTLPDKRQGESDGENSVEKARDFLESLFKSMEMKIDFDGRYSAEANELTVNLSGEDMGVLIGKRGQTLDALQYLTGQVVNKHRSSYIRVKLDTENYRERRRETLETFAVNMAHKVKRNKRPVVLEPMNAYERRIIHSVLQNEKDIITRSEGEEPYRHVVICPVKRKGSSKQQQD